MGSNTEQLHGIVLSPAGERMLIAGRATLEDLVGWPYPEPGLDVPMIVDRRFCPDDADAYTDLDEWRARCEEQEAWDLLNP